MRKGLLLAAAAVVAASAGGAVAAAGGSTTPVPAGSAVTFVSHVVRDTVANRYGKTWKSLDPAQQQLVPRDVYMRCEKQSAIPGRLRSLRVLGSAPATVHVPVSGRLSGWSVRLRLVIAEPAFPAVVVVHTFHAVLVDGDWHWYLPAERFALYGNGCGRTALPAA